VGSNLGSVAMARVEAVERLRVLLG
jgi:hypothetical protein